MVTASQRAIKRRNKEQAKISKIAPVFDKNPALHAKVESMMNVETLESFGCAPAPDRNASEFSSHGKKRGPKGPRKPRTQNGVSKGPTVTRPIPVRKVNITESLQSESSERETASPEFYAMQGNQVVKLIDNLSSNFIIRLLKEGAISSVILNFDQMLKVQQKMVNSEVDLTKYMSPEQCKQDFPRRTPEPIQPEQDKQDFPRRTPEPIQPEQDKQDFPNRTPEPIQPEQLNGQHEIQQNFPLQGFHQEYLMSSTDNQELSNNLPTNLDFPVQQFKQQDFSSLYACDLELPGHEPPYPDISVPAPQEHGLSIHQTYNQVLPNNEPTYPSIPIQEYTEQDTSKSYSYNLELCDNETTKTDIPFLEDLSPLLQLDILNKKIDPSEFGPPDISLPSALKLQNRSAQQEVSQEFYSKSVEYTSLVEINQESSLPPSEQVDIKSLLPNEDPVDLLQNTFPEESQEGELKSLDELFYTGDLRESFDDILRDHLDLLHSFPDKTQVELPGSYFQSGSKSTSQEQNFENTSHITGTQLNVVTENNIKSISSYEPKFTLGVTALPTPPIVSTVPTALPTPTSSSGSVQSSPLPISRPRPQPLASTSQMPSTRASTTRSFPTLLLERCNSQKIRGSRLTPADSPQFFGKKTSSKLSPTEISITHRETNIPGFSQKSDNQEYHDDSFQGEIQPKEVPVESSPQEVYSGFTTKELDENQNNGVLETLDPYSLFLDFPNTIVEDISNSHTKTEDSDKSNSSFDIPGSVRNIQESMSDYHYWYQQVGLSESGQIQGISVDSQPMHSGIQSIDPANLQLNFFPELFPQELLGSHSIFDDIYGISSHEDLSLKST